MADASSTLVSSQPGSFLSCISCRLMFHTPKEQRDHYKSDLHRFNLKRKVAELPPVTPEVFQEKVQSALAAEKNASVATPALECSVCGKRYSSANALEQHLRSKKHLDVVESGSDRSARSSPRGSIAPLPTSVPNEAISVPTPVPIAVPNVESAAVVDQPADNNAMETDQPAGQDGGDSGTTGASDAADEEAMMEAEMQRRLKNKLGPDQCLFCTHCAKDQTACLAHMTREHSLFLPDLEYLVDLPGLLAYLAEKVSVGYCCLWCNQQNFQSVFAVQAHMRDRSHCKIRYSDDESEYVDYYDFSSDWMKDPNRAGPVDEELDEAALAGGAHLSDDGHALHLADGRVVGHRTFALYYRQRFRPEDSRESVRTLISEYKALGWTSQALVLRPPTYLALRQKQHIERQQYNTLRVGMKTNNLKRPRRNFLAANAGY